jgi:hypothetical protein
LGLFFCLFTQSSEVPNSQSVRYGEYPLDLVRFTSGVQDLGLFFCLFMQSSEVSNSQSVRSGDASPLDLDDRDLL